MQAFMWLMTWARKRQVHSIMSSAAEWWFQLQVKRHPATAVSEKGDHLFSFFSDLFQIITVQFFKAENDSENVTG